MVIQKNRDSEIFPQNENLNSTLKEEFIVNNNRKQKIKKVYSINH